MRRRAFITLLGGAATLWPLAARAQQAGKLPTIGFLGSSTPSAASQWVAAFLRRLHELNWIENRNVAIEYRWAEGRSERYAEIAAELVRLKVDVIVAHGTQAVIAAKQATAVTWPSRADLPPPLPVPARSRYGSSGGRGAGRGDAGRAPGPRNVPSDSYVLTEEVASKTAKHVTMRTQLARFLFVTLKVAPERPITSTDGRMASVTIDWVEIYGVQMRQRGAAS